MFMDRMKVTGVARSAEELQLVRRECMAELKERMWSEVWRDMVSLPVKESVRRVDDWYEITVEIK